MSVPDSKVSWEDAVRELMVDPDQRQLVRDCYLDEPRDVAAERYRASDEWQSISKLLPSVAGSVLDVGSGHGITCYALSCSGWTVTALEPDPSALVGAAAIRSLSDQCALGVTVVESTGEEMPFDNGSFDLVFARQVFHHASDIDLFCREIFRVLRPGGVFLAVRDHVVSNEKQLAMFFENHPLHRLYGGEYAYTKKAYIGAIKNASMQIEKVLAPFDSPINYAPLNEISLREELVARVTGIPGLTTVMRSVLGSDVMFGAFKHLLNVIDSRPGRLYSFICRKPSQETGS